MPGAPSSASTTRPESSAKAGSCAALAAAIALIVGIGAKVCAGFVGLAEAELAGGYRLDAVRRQQFAHLGELAGIVGRDHELAGFTCWVAIFAWRAVRPSTLMTTIWMPVTGLRPSHSRHGHLLQVDQPRHALARQRHQRQELVLRKRRLLRGALHLDDVGRRRS